VIVLQHPKEVNHTKGTIGLLVNSLSNCQLIIGENFTDNYKLNELLSTFNPLLLYPSEQAKILPMLTEPKNQLNKQSNGNVTEIDNKTCLLILDGTWKKAYRMLMLSQNLQSIPHVCLPQEFANSGEYIIRKVAKANALSSLEATCYALALLESYSHNQPLSHTLIHYQPLLNKFAQFNQFQLSFRPQ
jgi:DTW domain-containing protein YfiP